MIAKVQLTEAIRAAAHYLIGHCGENGRFDYRLNLDPGVVVKPKYNLVRHAGAICALAWYYDRMKDDAALPAVRKASQYLRANIAPVSDSPLRHAVWSRREVEGRRQRTQCKLGASGLALAALSLTRCIDMEFATISELAALAEFVLFMQTNSGRFYSKYYPRLARRSDKWTSLYYPGEAALGLLMAHQHCANPQWLLAAERALVYLAKQRQGRFPAASDHWALMATAEYFRLNPASGAVPTSDALLQHAIQISESMLSEQLQSGGASEDRGWFTPDRRTTPTATRIEGLLATLRFLPESMRELRDRIILAVARGLHMLLRTQIRTGPYVGGIPREMCGATSNSRGPSRCPRATEVRIDYVQHTLCAMVQFSDLDLPSERTSIYGPPFDWGVCQIDVRQF